MSVPRKQSVAANNARTLDYVCSCNKNVTWSCLNLMHLKPNTIHCEPIPIFLFLRELRRWDKEIFSKGLFFATLLQLAISKNKSM